MSDFKPSFTRGIFSGVVHDELVFPYPAGLDRKNPDEAELVLRLIGELDRMSGRNRISVSAGMEFTISTAFPDVQQ